MKKFIAMLLVGGLVLTGCGNTEVAQKETVTTEETAEVNIEETDESGEQDSTEVAANTAEANTQADTYTTYRTASGEEVEGTDPHLITTHAAENAEPDDTAEYFPEATSVGEAWEYLRSDFPLSATEYKLGYTIEHRVFDGLSMEGSCTEENLRKILDIVTNEFTEEFDLDAGKELAVAETKYESGNAYIVNDMVLRTQTDFDAILAEVGEEEFKRMSDSGELFDDTENTMYQISVVHTTEDPANGVTVVITDGYKYSELYK